MQRRTVKPSDAPKDARPNSQNRKGAPKGRGNAPAAARWAAFFLFLTVVFAVAFYDVLGAPDPERIGEGVYIGPVDSGGKTSETATSALNDFLRDYRLTFSAGSREETVGPFVPSDPRIVDFQEDVAVENAYRIGRNDNSALALAERIGAAVFGARISVPYSLDEDALVEALRERFSPMVGRAENARLEITMDGGGFDVSVVPEKEGVFFDTASLLADTRDRLRSLSTDAVAIAVVEENPEVRAGDLEPLVATAEEAMKRAPRTVTVKGLTWEITAGQLAEWLTPVKDGSGWSVGLDREKVGKLLETRGTEIAINPQDAVFKEENGRVVEFSPGINGEKLDVASSIALLESAFLGDGQPDGMIRLPVMVAEPEITTEKSNPYGIKEIFGQGESNFRGSPPNRRHNIKTGAASLHGVIIAPGEEFSLLKALGEIDGEHGYLEELVIKEKETKPEYGGGLCQIGTTTFRTALNAGLPITERRNHSYRVPYYERDGDGNYMGPGVDATIYDPSPDLKFLNDSKHHLLFMTDIDGTKLTFTLWGVKDGRKAEMGEVAVWDITPPPEKQEIRTTEIPPGTTKCTESPHSGAKTNFKYTVTYADGEVKEDEFYSNYRAWGEVCLIGVTEEELAAWEAQQAAEETGAAPTGEGGIEGVVG